MFGGILVIRIIKNMHVYRINPSANHDQLLLPLANQVRISPLAHFWLYTSYFRIEADSAVMGAVLMFFDTGNKITISVQIPTLNVN